MRLSQILVTAALAAVVVAHRVPAQEASEFIPRSSEIYFEASSAEDLRKAFAADGPYRDFFAIPGFEAGIPLPLIRAFFDVLADQTDGQIAVSVEFSFPAQVKFHAAARSKSDIRSLAARIQASPEFHYLELGPGENDQSFEVAEVGEFAFKNGFLFLSSSMKEIEKLSELPAEESMSQYSGLRQLRERSPDAQLRGFFRRDLVLGDFEILGLRPDEFLGTILLEGLRQDIAQAESVFFQAELLPELKVQVRGLGRKHRKNWTNPDGSAETLPTLAGEIGRLSLNHDLDQFWRYREKIVSADALPGLATFTQNFDTLLTGISTAEVIASLSPGLEMILLDKDRENSSGRPLLPRLVLALNLKSEKDDEFRDRLRVAFQTTIGAINLSAGAERRRPYLQYSRREGDIEILAARFVGAKAFDEEQLGDNFQPAFAMDGHRLFLCSDIDAAVAAVAAYGEGKERQKAMPNSVVLRGSGVARILSLNRDLLENERVLKEGESIEEAAAFVDSILSLAQSLEELRFGRRLWSKGALWDLQLKRREQR